MSVEQIVAEATAALASAWGYAVQETAPLDARSVAWSAVIGLAVVLAPGLWPIARNAVTIVHEAGHAFVGTLVGRRITGIRVHSDTSGVTLSRGRPRGPGMVATLAAGYPAGAALGLVVAWLASLGYAHGVLALLIVILALSLAQIRNWYGLWVLLVAGAVVLAVAFRLPEPAPALFATALATFFGAGSLRTCFELAAARRGPGGSSDADQLGDITVLPAGAWLLVFTLVSGVGLAGSLWMLGLLPQWGLR